MQERKPIKSPDEVLPNSGTHSIERTDALRLVLAYFGLPFRVVAGEGAPYPDGSSRVPKGTAFVTYDTGNIPKEVIWDMVNHISPISMTDGNR
jgi:hypothetical protein